MYKYLPNYIVDSIYNIELSKLKKLGIKGIVVDIDNTLVPMFTEEPGEKAVDWVRRVKNEGFKICIVSNAKKKRTQLFMKRLGIHGFWLALKPFRYNFLKAAKHMNLKPKECVMIGDQLFTDIKGGKKAGFLTIMTRIMDNEEIKYVQFKRYFEKRILDKYIERIKKI